MDINNSLETYVKQENNKRLNYSSHNFPEANQKLSEFRKLPL